MVDERTSYVSHAISRFLLRNWREPGGKLRVYDFTEGKIERAPVAKVHTSPTPYPPDIEDMLSEVVERPLGMFVKRSKDRGQFMADCTADEDHALALALFLQAPRTALAKGNETDVDYLRRMLSDRQHAATIIALMRERYGSITGANLVHDRLFFPSTGTIALPLAGEHGYMLPLTPTSFVAMLPRQADQDGINHILRIPGLVTHLSVGIVGDRVIAPPSTFKDDDLAAYVRAARESTVRFNRLFLEANAKIIGGSDES